MRLEVSSAKRRSFCLGLKVLNYIDHPGPSTRIDTGAMDYIDVDPQIIRYCSQA